MGLGARLRLDGRPAPGRVATVVSIATLVVSPVVLLLVYGSFALNTHPTTGSTFVTLHAVPLSDTGRLMSSDDVNLSLDMTIDVETFDPAIGRAYYLPGDLGHVAVLLAVALSMLVALLVLLRRPSSRVLAGGLVLYGAFAAVAAWAGPAARTWAVDHTIATYDLPTTAAQARAVGMDFTVDSSAEDWFEWPWIFGVLAAVTFAAALYVLHARRQTTTTPPAVAI